MCSFNDAIDFHTAKLQNFVRRWVTSSNAGTSSRCIRIFFRYTRTYGVRIHQCRHQFLPLFWLCAAAVTGCTICIAMNENILKNSTFDNAKNKVYTSWNGIIQKAFGHLYTPNANVLFAAYVNETSRKSFVSVHCVVLFIHVEAVTHNGEYLPTRRHPGQHTENIHKLVYDHVLFHFFCMNVREKFRCKKSLKRTHTRTHSHIHSHRRHISHTHRFDFRKAFC